MGKRVIRISVRALVEFILRSGDLDGRRGSLAERESDPSEDPEADGSGLPGGSPVGLGERV